MVVLILLAVLLGLLWGARFTKPTTAIATTVIGWAAAMAIVVATTNDIDAGFWIFNSVLLIVGVGLTKVGARWNPRRSVAAR